MTPELLSLADVTAITNLSLSTVKRLINRRDLPAFRVGRKIVVRHADVTAWVETLRPVEAPHVSP